jgi:Flp pilus assembly protein TadG
MKRLLREFARDERGVFAVVFALVAVVLIALGGAVVDYVTLEQTRARAQTALDAAVLALQPELYQAGVDEESIRERAEAIVLERIGDARIAAEVGTVDLDVDNGTLYLAGNFSMPTTFVRLVGVTELSAPFFSEATRGAVDLEVSVALDVTGSMAGDAIDDLGDALNDLIDAVVQDSQQPTYSKMALIPYAQSVNAGTYAQALRGPVIAAKNITGITFTSGTTRTITNITRAGTAVVTSSGHGFANGDWVYVWDVVGMTEVNQRAFQVAGRTNDTFQLSGENSNTHTRYSRNGQVRKCDNPRCEVRITSNGHGFSVNQYLHVTDVGGFTGLNNLTYRVASTTTNTLMLAGAPTNGLGSYTANTGKLHCTWQTATQGCTYFYFQSQEGRMQTFPITTCVTERAANAFNDQPPTASLVGRNYPASSNGCIANSIVPLTSDKTRLHAVANSLVAAGSTSGSLGALWSWYMLSPNFGYVWPAPSRPAPYRQANLLKAAIIMTDGDFNTVHNQGVVAQNSTTGSGNTYDKINQNAHNGTAFVQARAYCDAMKATGIIVYTVGFNISSGSQAANILSYCASSSGNAYLANSGTSLASAFEQIARDISSLRLSL